jgi:leucyl-tRNA synthetase
VIWTEAGVQGAGRFIQRIWRLVTDIAERPKTTDGGTPSEDAMEVRRAAHKALDAVGRNIEALRFNVAVAQIYEFTNALSAASGKKGSDLDAALHECAVILVKIIAPMMPHLAEESWARLGYNTLLAKEPWPEANPALLVDDRVTLAVQVNGKRRGEITLARAATNAEAEAAALALEPVVKALEGRPAKKVIVVPQRIVNIVA